MLTTLCLEQKIEMLKMVERYGYQVAHYVLEDDHLAMEATKLALLEVSQNAEFYRGEQLNQRSIIKKAIIRQAIAVKKNNLALQYSS